MAGLFCTWPAPGLAAASAAPAASGAQAGLADDRAELEAFLWGDSDRLLSAAWDDTPASITQDQRHRFVITRYVERTMGADPKQLGDWTDHARQTQRNYLAWRWFREALRQAEAAAEPAIRAEFERGAPAPAAPSRFSFRRMHFPDTADPDAARAQATEAAQRLRTGESFVGLVEQFSLSADCLETLGPFGPGEINPTLEQALLAMEVDAVSTPVQTRWGWQVLQLRSLSQAPAATWEAYRTQRLRQERPALQRAILDELQGTPPVAAGEDGAQGAAVQTLVMFFSARLEREVTAAEALAIRDAAVARAEGAGLDQDADARRVREAIVRRAAADNAFEAAFARVSPPGIDEAALRAFYDAHPDWFREKERFEAEFIIVPGTDPAAAERASALAQAWREGRFDPRDTAQLQALQAEYDRTEGLIGVPQAGRQLHEAARHLQPGEVGEPVASAARGTQLVARLIARAPQPLRPFDPQDAELHRLFTQDRKNRFRAEVIAAAVAAQPPASGR